MDRNGLDALCSRLPEKMGMLIRSLSPADRANLEEIRVYSGRNTELVIAGAAKEISVCCSMQGWLTALSAQALYSCERQMAMGYIPLPGGHRAGVCGRMVCETDGAWRMIDVSSICIRIGRHVQGASRPVRPYLLDSQGRTQRLLVLGAPGSGKTTVLRDAAIWLAKCGVRVAVADEREELFGGGMRESSMDVLSGMDKARALPMLLRTMAPQIIVTDEIGGAGDALALMDALRCGTGLLVSAHACDWEEAMRRPAICELMMQRAFDGYVLLGQRGQVTAVYDGAGRKQEGKDIGQLGCGRDGHDGRQCGGISAL